MKLENSLNYKVNIKNIDGIRLRANDIGQIDYIPGARGRLEQFVIEKVGDDEYAIKTHFNTYLRFIPAKHFHSAKLEQGDGVIGPNERFKFIPQDVDDSGVEYYAIQTAGGTYIQVEDANQVGAESEGIAHTGKFQLELGLIEDGEDNVFDGIDLSDAKIAFKTKRGTYLRAGNNDKINNKAESIKDRELFKIVTVEANQKRYAINNTHYKTFIRVKEDKEKNVVNQGGDTIGKWETFKIIKYDDRRCVIETVHDTYLTVAGDQIKHKNKVGPKQIFDLFVHYV